MSKSIFSIFANVDAEIIYDNNMHSDFSILQ
jgi:hypothetical protein